MQEGHAVIKGINELEESTGGMGTAGLSVYTSEKDCDIINYQIVLAHFGSPDSVAD